MTTATIRRHDPRDATHRVAPPSPDTVTRQAAALLELVAETQTAESIGEASSSLAQAVKQHHGIEQVAVGWCRRPGKGAILRALSGTSRFDRHSDRCRAIEAALDEVARADRPLVWSASAEFAPAGTMALAHLAQTAGHSYVAGVAFKNRDAIPVGALLMMGSDTTTPREDTDRFLSLAAPLLAGSLSQIARAESRPLRRLCRRFVPQSWLWKCAAVGAAITTAAVMTCPYPYRITTPAKLEPVERRYVSAPFTGTLDRACVEPGDEVQVGQTLALLDGRELRWELSGLDAEYGRAEKQRDMSMARRESAAAHQAQLEMQRIELKRSVLNHRIANLEIASPVTGIVVSGDLSKAHHAPVEVGRKLFEVAPLDAMTAELAIPEEDVAHTRIGQSVEIKLDTWPGETWTGQIASIRPRAEQRDNVNVFIAEVRIENDAGQLRPGMNGHAKITSDERAIGWILLHKPIAAVSRWLGL